MPEGKQELTEVMVEGKLPTTPHETARCEWCGEMGDRYFPGSGHVMGYWGDGDGETYSQGLLGTGHLTCWQEADLELTPEMRQEFAREENEVWWAPGLGLRPIHSVQY